MDRNKKKTAHSRVTELPFSNSQQTKIWFKDEIGNDNASISLASEARANAMNTRRSRANSESKGSVSRAGGAKLPSISSGTADGNMKHYLDETSKWRQLRKAFNMPELRYEFLSHMQGSMSSTVQSGKFLDKLNNFVKNLEDNQDFENRSNLSFLMRTRFQPTYQLGPFIPFRTSHVHDLMKIVLDNTVDNLTNDTSPLKSESSIKPVMEHLTTTIKSRVKAESDKRYKIVVFSTICELKHQDMIVASKCLWNLETDRSVSIKETFRNYVITVQLYAIYKD